MKYNPVMRMLHCHSGNLFGGIERALLALVAAPNTGLTSEFALCFEGAFANELRAARYNPKILGPVRFRSPLSVWTARKRFAKAIVEKKPDWVLTHGLWSFRLAYPVARRCGIPIAIWVHDVFQGHSWLERPGLYSPDKIFATSQFTAQGVPRVFPGRWPEVLPPPLATRAPDESARSRVRAELGASRETVVILMAGRFEPLKGHGMLLKTLSRVAVNVPTSIRWCVWIAGDAQRPAERLLKTQLEAQAEALGGRVKFLGHRTDIAALYSAADIYCQPNVGPEAYGLTFAEAAVGGLPVVTTRLGAGPELVDNDIGRLVPPSDEIALASALTELVGSAELRQTLGAEAARRAKRIPDARVIANRLAHHLQGEYVSRLAV